MPTGPVAPKRVESLSPYRRVADNLPRARGCDRDCSLPPSNLLVNAYLHLLALRSSLALALEVKPYQDNGKRSGVGRVAGLPVVAAVVVVVVVVVVIVVWFVLGFETNRALGNGPDRTGQPGTREK